MPEKRNELFKYFSGNIIRGAIGFVLLLLLLLTLKHFMDEYYEDWIVPVADRPVYVFSFFFISEITSGFIPPEVFMFLYLKKPTLTFWKIVAFMTLLSYIGGACAFFIGRYFGRRGHLERWRESPRYGKLIEYYDKFDGILLVIAAVTPLPFALVSMVSGALNHTFWHYMKFAFSVRFLRFFPYAYLLWKFGKVDWMQFFKSVF